MTSLPEVLNGLLALEGKVFGGLMIFLSIWSRAIKNGNYGGGLGKKRISQFLVIGIVFFISIWISKEFIFQWLESPLPLDWIFFLWNVFRHSSLRRKKFKEVNRSSIHLGISHSL
jgi:hypothetical protein